MSRKTLLTEAEIRSFMKLANLGAVGNTRIQEMSMDVEDELEEEAPPAELDKFAADDLEDDSLMGDEEAAADELEADDEMDMDMGAPADAGGGQMVSVDDFMSALEGALEDALGEPVEVDMDEEPPADDGEDMELDVGMDAPDGDLEMDMDVEEEPGMRDMYENQDDLVQEVARRVAARLQKETSKREMVDHLAERIMKRLTQ